MPTVNYDVNPDALKTIESKIRQIQATGANITPEMMQSIYSSVLEAGAESAGRRAEHNAQMKQRAAEFNINKTMADRRLDLEEERLKSNRNIGLGGAIGKTMLYGGRYANKKGWLDPLKSWGNKGTPGGTTTPEPLKTIGGQEIGSQPATPSILGENPITGYTSPESMANLELTPLSEVGEALPGPVTETATADLGLTAPSVETGGEVPTALSNVGELGTAVTPEATELASGLGTSIGEASTETLASATPEIGYGSVMGPVGAGSLGYGLTKAFGVNDDIGKALLFGEGGKNEQDIASGVGTGAAMGAAAGTYVFPGIGTAIGGLLGAIGGGMSAALDDLF